ncbi:hypothetical protein Tco_0491781, partial [Tanacetum coccineum]
MTYHLLRLRALLSLCLLQGSKPGLLQGSKLGLFQALKPGLRQDSKHKGQSLSTYKYGYDRAGRIDLQPIWQPSQQPVNYVAASAAANNLCCNLHSSLQLMWQPSQQLANYVAASVAAWNLCCSLHSSLQPMWQPPRQPATSVATFVAASNLRSSLKNPLQPSAFTTSKFNCPKFYDVEAQTCKYATLFKA